MDVQNIECSPICILETFRSGGIPPSLLRGDKTKCFLLNEPAGLPRVIGLSAPSTRLLFLIHEKNNGSVSFFYGKWGLVVAFGIGEQRLNGGTVTIKICETERSRKYSQSQLKMYSFSWWRIFCRSELKFRPQCCKSPLAGNLVIRCWDMTRQVVG